MSFYQTEEEQLEAIKKWWSKYSNMITIALVIMLTILLSYKYWHWQQTKFIANASNQYESLLAAVSNQNPVNIEAYSNNLIKNYNGTIYATVAHLILAKLYITQNQYAKAEDNLKFILASKTINTFKELARIRLARLYLENKAYERALTTLKTVDDAAYKGIVLEIQGDIYSAMSKEQEAKFAYNEATKLQKAQGLSNLFLEFKHDALN